jgi:hypothetical protein
MKKTYEILTPIMLKPGGKPIAEGTIELDAEDGDELVKLNALRPVVGASKASAADDGNKSEDLSKMNLAALTELATLEKVELPEKANKAQIVELIGAQRAKAAEQ